jgi:hypothetical protein
LQLPFRDGELREATIQTNDDLRKNPHDGFVKAFESAEVDRKFTVEHALVIGMASFTGHGETLISDVAKMIQMVATGVCSILNTSGEMPSVGEAD